jgi:hypothetical protein
MSVALFRQGGFQFFDSNGAPLTGGQLFYYQAGTTLQAATYADQFGAILNPQPIALDSSGRLDVPVYFGSAYSYKELLTDQFGATISPWPFDQLPAASAAAPVLTGFERLYLPWIAITSASSPVTLGVSAAGNGYECDCTNGTITIDLPAAATSGLAGTGYFFKRVDSVVANSLNITPNGSDNIDGVNSALGVGPGYSGVYLVSDGAQWLTYSFFNQSASRVVSRQAVTASAASLSINMALGWEVSLSLAVNVTSFAVTNWPAAGSLGKLTLDISNTGAFGITGWPGTTKWPGGAKPVITSGTGALDTIMLTSVDGGNNFRGFIVGQNFS